MTAPTVDLNQLTSHKSDFTGASREFDFGALMPDDDPAPPPVVDDPAPLKPDAAAPPRAPDGKFAKATDKAPGTPPVDAKPPADPAAPVDPAAPAVVEPEVADGPEPVDFKFSAFRQEVSIPGAKYKEGVGVFVPEESLGHLRQMVGRGTQYDRMIQERDSYRQGVTVEQIKAQALAEIVDPVLTVEWLTGLGVQPKDAELALARLNAQLVTRNAALKDEYGDRIVNDRLTQAGSDEQDMRRQEHLDATLDRALVLPDVAKVLAGNPSARARVVEAAREYGPLCFVAAPSDGNGYKRGEIVFDAAKFVQIVRREIQPYAERPAAPGRTAAPPAPTNTKPPVAVSAPPSPAGNVTPSAGPPAPPAAALSARDQAKTQPWMQAHDAWLKEHTARA